MSSMEKGSGSCCIPEACLFHFNPYSIEETYLWCLQIGQYYKRMQFHPKNTYKFHHVLHFICLYKPPRWQSSLGQHGSHLGPVGPRWAPCWPHDPCYQGSQALLRWPLVPALFDCCYGISKLLYLLLFLRCNYSPMYITSAVVEVGYGWIIN